VTDQDIPQERDLPAGRLTQLKEDLMAHIEHDLESQSPGASAVTRRVSRRRWRRLGLAAAALAAGLGLATSLVLGGDGRASANHAERTADGGIVMTIREAQRPKDLERRLRDLGVPAVVDFLESGFGCDDARSTGWSQQPPSEALFSHAPDSADDELRYVLHPDELQPGETVVLEFQFDEHEGRIAASVSTRLSTSSVGECVPVRDASIVDAERGIAGG
jgi:hypothetical protein